MSEYATKGAMLTCTCGAAPSQLQVTSQTMFSVRGRQFKGGKTSMKLTNLVIEDDNAAYADVYEFKKD